MNFREFSYDYEEQFFSIQMKIIFHFQKKTISHSLKNLNKIFHEETLHEMPQNEIE